MIRRSIFALACLAMPPAAAEPLSIVTDIAPVHSLVARIVDGSGSEAAVLLPPGTSPHHYSMPPSAARAMSGADVVIWVGEGLTPWLVEPVETLAGGAAVLELIETRGWSQRSARDSVDFHGDEHDDHADHEEGHDDHADEDGHDHHDHGSVDPHAWLDPIAAAAWSEVIGSLLAAQDPENAGVYLVNAANLAAELRALSAELEGQLDGLDGAYLVAHDAYGYFEDRFGLSAAGAITLSDAGRPGPRHIATLREAAQAGDLDCILSDPQSGGEWVELVGENSDLRIIVGDPLGIDLTPGPELYPALLTQLGAAMVRCLSDEG